MAITDDDRDFLVQVLAVTAHGLHPSPAGSQLALRAMRLLSGELDRIEEVNRRPSATVEDMLEAIRGTAVPVVNINS